MSAKEVHLYMYVSNAVKEAIHAKASDVYV